ncbi:MAG: hypothetical protein GY953_36555, partial [bacterium]|nr:hypothetical protein [bacterium]
DGGLFGYSTLARYLADDQPVFGFEPPDPDDVGVRFKLEDLAARYVEHLRRLRPEGPYLLSGLCFGGLVAQEMACQMTQQGSDVPLLVLVDCPNSCGSPPRHRETLRHISRRLEYHWRAMLRADGAARYLKRRITEVLDRERERRDQGAFDKCVREGRPVPAHLRQIQFANQAAAKNHKPRPYSGRTMLIGA